jgi:hypothetical protein
MPPLSARQRKAWAPSSTVRIVLLLGDGDRGACSVPIYVHHALVEGDGEVLDGGGESGDLHIDTGKVIRRTRIVGAPFVGFLAEDESPFVFVGDGEERVGSGRYRSATDGDIGGVDEGGGFIGTGAPDLCEGNEFAKDFAALRARAGVIDGDGLTATQVESGFRRRAGALGLILLSVQDNNRESKGETKNRNCGNCFAHADLL